MQTIFENLKVKALGPIKVMYFLPPVALLRKGPLGVFTHGYTAQKDSILNWPVRLGNLGVASAIFDLPGHRLGASCGINDFEEFLATPYLFERVAWELKNKVAALMGEAQAQSLKGDELLLGGHSLGALLALKANTLEGLKEADKTIIAVGLGKSVEKANITHIFEDPFFEKTLKLRGQLVDEAIAPSVMFPWIKEEKKNLQMKGAKIHMIVGEDDVVVPRSQFDSLKEHLEQQGNQVSTRIPKKLPHHLPDMAASYINAFVKKTFNL